MDTRRSETTPDTILRLTDVLKRTGIRRSTLYNRIAKKEFPHQVSLGGRAVGWLKREVDEWVSERMHLRPGSATRFKAPLHQLENCSSCEVSTGCPFDLNERSWL